MSPLPGRPRPRTLRQRLVQAVGVSAVAALVTVALLPTGLNLANLDVTEAQDVPARTVIQTPADAHLTALMHRYRCSTEGFGHSAIPASAIIRRTDGRIRLVTFDRGWTIFRDHGPGSLVAVCLRPPPR